jgi:hypothetical protein
MKCETIADYNKSPGSVGFVKWLDPVADLSATSP